MKKIFLILLLLSGCGLNLQQIRDIPTFTTTTLSKEPFCLYNKLNKTALTIKRDSIWDESLWQSTWDPSTNTGEVFNVMPGLGRPHFVLFVVRPLDSTNTIVETKAAKGHGQAPWVLRWNQEYALKILSSTDFSSCPDLP